MSTALFYEALRLGVLRGGQSGQGWALLVRRGMRSWCDKCHTCGHQRGPTVRAVSSQSIFAESVEQGLVAVLAGMVINLQSEGLCHA